MSEVTLACVLLIGAGLMLRSFINLLRTDPGFRPEQVLTATVSLPRAVYKDEKAITLFSDRLLKSIRSKPGLSTTGLGSDLPWTGWDDNAGGFHLAGETAPPNQDYKARYHTATPGYFPALGIPLLRGRDFDDHDTADRPQVLIINQALAKSWRHGDPLGGRITFNDHPKEKDWMTIVGIVGDVKDTPSSAAATPAFWWPLPQAPMAFVDFSVVIRSNLAPASVADTLRSVVHDLDSTLAVSDVRTMDRVADASYATSRLALFLMALFAGLALILAAIGTYGVIAYSVSQRVHEFGVRMALGAGQRDLVVNVLTTGMKLALSGTVLGIALGLMASRLLGSLLCEVSTADPIAIGTTCLTSLAVAGLACCVPAFRATCVDPMTALRAD